MSQRSQSGRQERVDGWLLRSARAGVMASGTDGQREKLSACIVSGSQSGTPGKSGPAAFAFLCPKPPLGSFTKAIGLGSTMPSWRSGKTHGFCVTGGHSPIASEPTPSRRLWAAAPGATPAPRIEHTTGGRSDDPKAELSTLLERGTFYFALTIPAATASEPRSVTPPAKSVSEAATRQARPPLSASSPIVCQGKVEMSYSQQSRNVLF